MLRIIRGQRWLTGLFIVGIGGVFVFFLGLGGPLEGRQTGSIIEVGPYRFGINDFQRERNQREQQYRDLLGEGYDRKAFEDNLQSIATQMLVERAILALEAADAGLLVPNGEVERSVVMSTIFLDEEGRFNPEMFRNWAEREFGNERNFLKSQRLALLAGKMLRLLAAHVHVSEGEARAAVQQGLEEVRIGFLVLDASQPPEEFELTEEALASFRAEREPEARALYEERAEIYDVPEKVRSRHILLRVEADADAARVADVEARAAELLERLRAGQDFAALAEEHSDDPGSKNEGGDLGFFPRGRMLPAFEEAAFALEPGELSGLVRTDFGIHLIRTEEKTDAHSRSFEDAIEEIAREVLGAAQARGVARETAERLLAGVREGRTLEDVTRENELTLERSGWLRRRPDGFVPGLGPAPDALAVAFTMEPGETSQSVFEVGDSLVLLQTLERQQPAPEEIEAAVADARKQLIEERRITQTSAWISMRREALNAQGNLFVDFDSIRDRS